MWLEEIILDGFKSYAQQTRIRPLDRSFTAITGLNGSGKSNILDAICFVLGISQLSRIRVNSLTDLIYKQGQAGITKASVSLIFNNQNVKLSPQGYESSEYLTITRQILQNGTTNETEIDQTALHVGFHEHQQPEFPDHAGPNSSDSEHEAATTSFALRRDRWNVTLRPKSKGGGQNVRFEAAAPKPHQADHRGGDSAQNQKTRNGAENFAGTIWRLKSDFGSGGPERVRERPKQHKLDR